MSRSRLAFAALALAAPGAYAHHSPAAYDMAAQVTIEGTVADFEWANPHAYVSLQETTGEKRVWQIELLSPSSLKRYGWTATTLASGDRIKVLAHPGRNPARNVAFLQTLERSGTLLLDARRVITDTVPPPQNPGAPSVQREEPRRHLGDLAGSRAWATARRRGRVADDSERSGCAGDLQRHGEPRPRLRRISPRPSTWCCRFFAASRSARTRS